MNIRMRCAVRALLLAAMFQACAVRADPAAAAQPYDFRGFYVGMGLQQYRHTPPPLPPDGSPKASCPKLIDPDDARRWVVRCTWLKTLADGHSVQAQLVVGDVLTRDYSFVFFADRGSRELRLQEINFLLSVKGRAQVFRRLSEKFGEPQHTAVNDDVWLAQWRNASGTVTLRSSVADGSTLVNYRLGAVPR